MAALHTSKQKADLKVVIMGSANVGKTTFIHRYMEGCFQETISQTIGASFFLKQQGPYNVAIWDTAGEERFTGLSSFYCRNAGAAILAYDMTREESFNTLRMRFAPLLQAADPDCYVILVGMKQDLAGKNNVKLLDKTDILLFAKEVNARKLDRIPVFETSSITGQNVNSVFEEIFQICLPGKPPTPGTVDVDDITLKPQGKSSGCGC